ncbi:MAG: DUF2892 domain-containing protein [Hyphomicrobiaceae bacterium]
MTCNIGNIERVLRAIVGLGIISLVFVGPQSPWGWLGLVPLATAVVGWCPPYALLGINTCGAKNPQTGDRT